LFYIIIYIIFVENLVTILKFKEMRTINVNPEKNILDQVASALENDILVNENAIMISCCVDEAENCVTQYELDNHAEIVSEITWYVDKDIKEGLCKTVNIDC
jgi:hypothetical protein